VGSSSGGPGAESSPPMQRSASSASTAPSTGCPSASAVRTCATVSIAASSAECASEGSSSGCSCAAATVPSSRVTRTTLSEQFYCRVEREYAQELQGDDCEHEGRDSDPAADATSASSHRDRVARWGASLFRC